MHISDLFPVIATSSSLSISSQYAKDQRENKLPPFFLYERNMQAWLQSSCEPSSSSSHPLYHWGLIDQQTRRLPLHHNSRRMTKNTNASSRSMVQSHPAAAYMLITGLIRSFGTGNVGHDQPSVCSETAWTSSSALMKSLAVSPSEGTPGHADNSQNSSRHPTLLSAVMNHAMSPLAPQSALTETVHNRASLD